MNEIIKFLSNNKVISYIFIGLSIYFVLNWTTKVIAFYWKQGYEYRRKKRELKKIERLKWKYAKVTLDNPLLNNIVNTGHFIVIAGVPGAGKTIMANLLTKFVLDKRQNELNKKRRYYKYMNPKALEEELLLENECKLATYSNLEIKDNNNKSNKELMPYLLMQKKSVQKCVFLVDEIGNYMGKDLLYAGIRGNPLVENLEKIFRFIRQYLNGYIISTEQDGENIYIGIRRIGYTSIFCNSTVVQLSKFGKKLLKFTNFLNFILPGLITINYKRVFNSILFKEDKFKTILKLMLPTYFMLPKEYYTRRKEIYDKINKKHLRYLTKFTFNNAEYYIRYTNVDKYDYKTRAHLDEYNKSFNSDGTAKEKYISE